MGSVQCRSPFSAFILVRIGIKKECPDFFKLEQVVIHLHVVMILSAGQSCDLGVQLILQESNY